MCGVHRAGRNVCKGVTCLRRGCGGPWRRRLEWRILSKDSWEMSVQQRDGLVHPTRKNLQLDIYRGHSCEVLRIAARSLTSSEVRETKPLFDTRVQERVMPVVYLHGHCVALKALRLLHRGVFQECARRIRVRAVAQIVKNQCTL